MRVRRAGLCVLLALTVFTTGVSAASEPVFRASIQPIDASLARTMRGSSWRPGCPVQLRDLRVVAATHWGFDGRVRLGRVIVHRDAAAGIVAVLRRLYQERFPIRRMVPVDAYRGDDFRSIEADNTSAFNCRPVAGTSRWSQHSYGRAIDVNPIENPYVAADGTTAHPRSAAYLDRTAYRPGMALAGGPLVRAFDAIGWGWGGRWSSSKDYQHFSQTGS
jgi:hypothetical protein